MTNKQIINKSKITLLGGVAYMLAAGRVVGSGTYCYAKQSVACSPGSPPAASSSLACVKVKGGIIYSYFKYITYKNGAGHFNSCLKDFDGYSSRSSLVSMSCSYSQTKTTKVSPVCGGAGSSTYPMTVSGPMGFNCTGNTCGLF
jgi:hypothetical protein